MNNPAATSSRPRPLLEVTGLSKHFPGRVGLLGRRSGYVRAVDSVDLRVHTRESYGLVGESGSGKTTVARCVVRLIEPTAGVVKFEGDDVLTLKASGLRHFRSRAQIVFQDPYSSLDPRFTIERIVAEPLVIHGRARGNALRERVLELLDLVGLKRDHLYRYPHEFSGGQRQRIAIARAIAIEPKMLVLDEPTSALDVSVQAQILNLLNKLQNRLSLTFLMISHDLTVMEHMCDRIAVMHRGSVVEEGTATEIFHRPVHPYTRVLLASAPAIDGGWIAARSTREAATIADDETMHPLVEISPGHWARVAL
jgi:ABC-type oligopeptide transport system ATPase subunit